MTLLVYAPLGIEARTVSPGLPRARVIRSGMGPLRARRAAGSSTCCWLMTIWDIKNRTQKARTREPFVSPSALRALAGYNIVSISPSRLLNVLL